MPFIGKSGSDAIFKALDIVCRQIKKFGPKINAAVAQAQTDGVITPTQASAAVAFISTAQAVCDVFRAVAGNSGIYS